jgi:hypothetical protein
VSFSFPTGCSSASWAIATLEIEDEQADGGRERWRNKEGLRGQQWCRDVTAVQHGQGVATQGVSEGGNGTRPGAAGGSGRAATMWGGSGGGWGATAQSGSIASMRGKQHGGRRMAIRPRRRQGSWPLRRGPRRRLHARSPSHTRAAAGEWGGAGGPESTASAAQRRQQRSSSGSWRSGGGAQYGASGEGRGRPNLQAASGRWGWCGPTCRRGGSAGRTAKGQNHGWSVALTFFRGRDFRFTRESCFTNTATAEAATATDTAVSNAP